MLRTAAVQAHGDNPGRPASRAPEVRGRATDAEPRLTAAWTSTTHPKKPPGAPSAATWLEENAPTVAGAAAASTTFEIGGGDYLERARRWQALKFDAGFARITWEPEFGGRNGTTMQQIIFGQEEARSPCRPRCSSSGSG